MKVYTIIGGVNGTGKSSLTGLLKAQRNDLGILVDVDRMTARSGLSPVQGGKTALKTISDCLNRGLSFTQETTLSGHQPERTAAMAKQRDYKIRLYYVGLDTPQECLERIANRVRHGGHGIAEEDVLYRFSHRWESLSRILPYCEEAFFFDNGNGFAEVARYQNGELILQGDGWPVWILELKEFLRQKTMM